MNDLINKYTISNESTNSDISLNNSVNQEEGLLSNSANQEDSLMNNSISQKGTLPNNSINEDDTLPNNLTNEKVALLNNSNNSVNQEDTILNNLINEGDNPSNNLINGDTLLNYMPDYYKNSKVIRNLNTSMAVELNNLKKKIKNVLNQFYILTLDDELEHKEKEFGMKIDRSLCLEERRNRLLPKNRGQGTAKIEMLKSVAKSFAEEVVITEDNADYLFTINLFSTQGFPYKLDSLYEAIDTIKPAHLRGNYLLTTKTKKEINFGVAALSGEMVTIYPYDTKYIEMRVNAQINNAMDINYEIATIYPKK